MHRFRQWIFRYRRRRALERCRHELAQSVLAAMPDLNRPVQESALLALDFETTGLNPRRDAILSMGWVAMTPQSIRLGEAAHHVIRIERPLPEESVRIHGITHARMARGMPLCEALFHLLQAMRGRALLAHYAPIESAFLRDALRQCLGCAFPFLMVDTFDLARRMARWQVEEAAGAFRLHALRAQFGLPPAPPHHALEDAVATGELFLAQLAHRPEWRRERLGYLSRIG